MANLQTLQQWRAFAPDIGNNLELPAGEQFLLEVAVGLSFQELAEYQTSLKSTPPGDLPEILTKYVRVIGGPHTLAREPISSVADLWALLMKHAAPAIFEITTAVPHFNSVPETRALFFERRSGGSAFTPPRSAAKKDEKTAER